MTVGVFTGVPMVLATIKLPEIFVSIAGGPSAATSKVQTRADRSGQTLEFLRAGLLVWTSSSSTVQQAPSQYAEALKVAEASWGAARRDDRRFVAVQADELSKSAEDRAVYYRHDEGTLVVAGGAPSVVVPLCQTMRTLMGDAHLTKWLQDRWVTRAREMEADGMKVMAVATKSAKEVAPSCRDLALLGLAGFVST